MIWLDWLVSCYFQTPAELPNFDGSSQQQSMTFFFGGGEKKQDLAKMVTLSNRITICWQAWKNSNRSFRSPLNFQVFFSKGIWRLLNPKIPSPKLTASLHLNSWEVFDYEIGGPFLWQVGPIFRGKLGEVFNEPRGCICQNALATIGVGNFSP